MNKLTVAIKKPDAMKVAGITDEKAFDSKRAETDRLNTPIAIVGEKPVKLVYAPLGNAGRYNLVGEELTVREYLEAQGITPINSTEKIRQMTEAEALEYAGAPA